tara:strand:- start:1559 stop:2230 length:672 start_codon:yes stop_codon:yes gene_type:complete
MIKNKPSHKDNADPFWDFWTPLFITIALYFGIRNYIAEARYIPSGSMLPGLQINDRLLIEKLTFTFRRPKRGEIVVFNSPYSFDPILKEKMKNISSLKCILSNIPLLNLGVSSIDFACGAYIKRVVAIAGDKVLVNSLGEVFINGEHSKESYVKHLCKVSYMKDRSCPSFNKEVPKDHVFVLGDNRGNSWDGRFWPGSGFLPVNEILGRAVWRFWPGNRLGSI